MIDAPGVVTGRYGTIGQVFFIDEPFWPLNTTLYVSDFKGNDPRFASYLLRTVDFSPFSDKAAVPGVNRNHLHEAIIRWPVSVAEQKRAAGILGALDDRIALNRRMNATLEAISRALFKSLCSALGATSQADARGAASSRTIGDPTPASTTDAAPLPPGWRLIPIGELAAIAGGSTPSTSDAAFWENPVHSWATPKDLARLRTPALLSTERRISDAGLERIGSRLLAPGTVLLSSRAPIGYLAITDIPVAINQGFIAMTPRAGVSNLFLLRWTESALDDIRSLANGSTFLEISKAQFRRLMVQVPPADLLAAYDACARPLFARLVANERASLSLIALRDALVPKLVSGELPSRRVELTAY
jgi:type I restriction enzyme S subunit